MSRETGPENVTEYNEYLSEARPKLVADKLELVLDKLCEAGKLMDEVSMLDTTLVEWNFAIDKRMEALFTEIKTRRNSMATGLTIGDMGIDAFLDFLNSVD